jgi:hypothetical protein
MTRALGCALWAFLGTSSLRAADLSPQDFAFGLPVVTTTEASAYRVTLPPEVYQQTFREDVADIRVFNAQGSVVPYSLRRNAPTAARSARLPLFPLPVGSHVGIDGVRVIIDPRGSAVNWQTQPSSTATTPGIQYILDGRELDSAVEGLRLEWPDTDSEYSGHIRVDASDDLGSWRTVVAAAPIANLRANGQSIIQSRLVLPPTKAKFWRLSWLGSPPTFQLSSVSAETAAGAYPTRAALDTIGVRDSSTPQDYVFDLGAHAPVDRVNLLLPESNTVLNVELSSRRRPMDPWRPATRAGVYRVSTADGDHQNAALEIAVDRDRYWRARINSGGDLAPLPLRLHVEWIPDEVTFLARGHGPFLVAYGNSAATDAQADLARLPVNIGESTGATPVVLGGPSRLVARAAPFPRLRVALWSTLLLAVFGLAWIAYRLTQERGSGTAGSQKPLM